MGWKNAFDNAKPVFVTIYATVIIGIVFSSLYVISAIYSGKSAADSTTSWLSHVGSPPLEQAPNVSQPEIVQPMSTPSLGPQSMSTRPIWEAPPHTKKMPPLKKFRLSKELVQQRVKDNVVIVTFGNYAFMDFILTWVKHLTDLGLSNLLIGAMDTKLLEALYWKGVPVFDMGSHMSTIDVGWSLLGTFLSEGVQDVQKHLNTSHWLAAMFILNNNSSAVICLFVAAIVGYKVRKVELGRLRWLNEELEELKRCREIRRRRLAKKSIHA